MALSPQELAELQELEELELLEEQERNAKSIDTSVEPTTMEALSTGFVEGVPFMKDAIAGMDAIADQVVSENPMDLDSFVDRYRDNLDDVNRTINMAEETAPVATTIGDVAGSIASAIPAGASLAGSAAIGAASGLSRSEERGLTDVVAGAALGGAGKIAGDIAGKALSAPLKTAGKFLKDKADEALEAAIGSDRAFGARRIFKHLQVSKQSKEEFLDSVKKMDIVAAGDDVSTSLTKVQKVKDGVGKQLGNVYKQIDDEFAPEINVKEMKQRISDDIIEDLMASDDPGTREIGESLAEYVDNIGRKQTNIKSVMKPSGALDDSGNPIMIEEVTKDIVEDETYSLTRVHNLQKDIRARIASIFKRNGADATAAKEQQRKVAASLGNIIDDTLDSVSTAENPIYSQVKELRRQFGNAATVEEIMESRLASTKADPLNELKQLVGFRSMFLAGAGSAIGGPIGAAAGIALNAVMNNPKTPSYIANGLPRVANQLINNPTGKIASRLTLAASLSSDKFRNAMESSIAELNLKEAPIPRDSQKALTKSKDIQKVLKYHLPSLYKEYNKLLDTGNPAATAQFLDTLSKKPEAQELFEEGIGFDNKVFSVEDKQILSNQLKNQDMPSVERMKLLKDLESNGTIPDMSSVPQREPNRYIPRQNKEPKY